MNLMFLPPCFLIMVMASIAAVSYTHLDVYKRQSYYSASPRYITVGTKKESSDDNSDQKEEADNTSGDKKNE